MTPDLIFVDEVFYLDEQPRWSRLPSYHNFEGVSCALVHCGWQVPDPVPAWVVQQHVVPRGQYDP